MVDSHGQTDSHTITYSVKNINDAPVICDARDDVDPDCDNGNVYIYADFHKVLKDSTLETKASLVTVSHSEMWPMTH